MSDRFEGKVAAVTGAAGGFGRATAQRFAEDGANLVLIDLEGTAIEETAAAVERAGREALVVHADVTQAADVRRYVDSTRERFGRLDYFFNNAGILGPVAGLLDYPEEQFDRVIAVNLKGVWLGLREVAPLMAENGGGAIVNTASIAGLQATPTLFAYGAGEFAFLARTADFTTGIPWEDLPYTPLWRYQMQYLQPVLDLVLEGRADAARALLDSWREVFEERWHPEAWHPYPASLRLANLCHAAAAGGSFDALGEGIPDLLATHAAYVLAHLETDVRGNHLLENARALLIASRFLTGRLADDSEAAARRILKIEIPEQVLTDGAHFELSPMYHCIVLQRLLEMSHVVGLEHGLTRGLFVPAVRDMSLYLESILCPDGGIPLFGDAVRGFAPDPRALLDESSLVVGVAEPAALELSGPRSSGLHVLRSQDLVAFLDAGPVCPAYLPAHAQADALTVEVWARGVCLVADPGVHEYTGEERAWGRSSRAHSTVTVDDRDSSEVYGSFRAGGRASIQAEREGCAVLLPWNDPARITRTISFDAGGALLISDRVEAVAGRDVKSRLQLHEAVRIESCDGTRAALATSAGRVLVTCAGTLETEPSRRSPRFGVIERTMALVATLAHADGVYSGSFTIQVADA